MYIFAEPVTEEQIKEIESKSTTTIEAFRNQVFERDTTSDNPKAPEGDHSTLEESLNRIPSGSRENSEPSWTISDYFSQGVHEPPDPLTSTDSQPTGMQEDQTTFVEKAISPILQRRHRVRSRAIKFLKRSYVKGAHHFWKHDEVKAGISTLANILLEQSSPSQDEMSKKVSKVIEANNKSDEASSMSEKLGRVSDVVADLKTHFWEDPFVRVMVIYQLDLSNRLRRLVNKESGLTAGLIRREFTNTYTEKGNISFDPVKILKNHHQPSEAQKFDGTSNPESSKTEAINTNKPQDFPPLLTLKLNIENFINGIPVAQVQNLTYTDELESPSSKRKTNKKWELKYQLEEIKSPEKAWMYYNACRRRRRDIFDELLKKPDSTRTSSNSESPKWSFTSHLRQLSKQGTAWRAALNEKEKDMEPRIYGVPPASTSNSSSENANK
jgi:hypothetical protein